MNELIKITKSNGIPVVLARELHNFLDVPTHFKDWIHRMLQYDFQLGRDYRSIGYSFSGEVVEEDNIPRDGIANNLRVDRREYLLTVDAAKEMCMLQRSERGKEARRYFIEIEKKYRQSKYSTTIHVDMPEKEIFTSIKYIRDYLEVMESQVKVLATKALLAPKPPSKVRLVPKRTLEKSNVTQAAVQTSPSVNCTVRPKTRGQLLKALQDGKRCEVPEGAQDVTSIILSTAHNFPNFKVYPSENIGWVIYQALESSTELENAAL